MPSAFQSLIYRLFLLLLAVFFVSQGASGPIVAATAPSVLHFRVVDDKGNSVSDAVVTVNGKLLQAGNDGSYIAAADTPLIQARAVGYRAVARTAADIAKNGNRIALTPFTVQALYLTEFGIVTRALRDPAFEMIRRGKANALVVNIKTDNGMLPYKSAIPLAAAIGARKLTTLGNLADLVKNCHAQGIYMIARIPTFKDNTLATARPDLAIHTESGELYRDHEKIAWTDPFKPEVRSYIIAVAVEAAQAGFDEVQFDYVRFPDAAVKLRFSGPTDEANRVQVITSFLEDAHKALVPYNVFQSADIFGYTFWNTNDTGIGQHLEEITRTVDYVCPMLYPSGFRYGIPGHSNPMATNEDIYNTIKLTLDRGLSRTRANPKKFRPWLQAFRDYAFGHKVFGPEEIAQQIRAANDDHTDGWTLWNPRNNYDNTGFLGIKPQPASVTGTKQ